MDTTRSPDGAVGPLRQALMVCHASGMSGVLRVTGRPGGAVHLADGLVAAVQTPGAPGPEVLLLRSKRVSEADWDEAFAAAAVAGRPMSAELTARQLTGAGELEALLRIALADAMFALASGTVEEYRSEPGPVDVALPLDPGAEAPGLLAEVTRRIGVLQSLPQGYREGRVKAVPTAAEEGSRLGQRQAGILALADGRRTARDIAFALGCGVYATRLELARLYQAGLVVPGPSRDRRPQPEPVPVSPPPHRERRGMAVLPWRSRDQNRLAQLNGRIS